MRKLLQLAASLLRRLRRTLIPMPHRRLYLDAVAARSGLEIGGPSSIFQPGNVLPLYSRVASLDNCDFSATTVWANHEKAFIYHPGRPAGRSFFCEGSDLAPVPSAAYDFLLSSHNLEHFANPLKALHEWKRVLRPGGVLVLVLPHFRHTFDHRRSPTSLDHMLQDFANHTGEDDLTHLPEVLARHDLDRDRAAGGFAAFQQRSLDNLHNRCLHHHVFDESNSRDLLQAAGFAVLTVDTSPPFHLCLLARSL